MARYKIVHTHPDPASPAEAPFDADSDNAAISILTGRRLAPDGSDLPERGRLVEADEAGGEVREVIAWESLRSLAAHLGW
jgi:hypothetical protein